MPKTTILTKMKDIFGRGGYTVSSPGTNVPSPSRASEKEMVRGGKTPQQIADEMASGESYEDRKNRQHRKDGNT